MKVVKERTADEGGMKEFSFEIENDFRSCYFVKDGEVVCSLEAKEMKKFLKESIELIDEYVNGGISE